MKKLVKIIFIIFLLAISEISLAGEMNAEIRNVAPNVIRLTLTKNRSASLNWLIMMFIEPNMDSPYQPLVRRMPFGFIVSNPILLILTCMWKVNSLRLLKIFCFHTIIQLEIYKQLQDNYHLSPIWWLKIISHYLTEKSIISLL